MIIEMEIALYADSGEPFKTEIVNVWQAIFRVPETYLRKEVDPRQRDLMAQWRQ